MSDKKIVYCTIPIEFPTEIQNANNVFISDDVINDAINKINDISIVLSGGNKTIGVIKKDIDGFNNAILWSKVEPEIIISEKHIDENGVNVIDKFEICAVSLCF